MLFAGEVGAIRFSACSHILAGKFSEYGDQNVRSRSHEGSDSSRQIQ